MSEDLDEYKLERPSMAKRVGISLAFVLVLALVFGLAGQLSGTGWFGYRSFMYGDGELYALNMSFEKFYVSVDGRERVEVPPRNAEIISIVGGESSVVVTDESGEVKGRYAVVTDHSHAFLKLSPEECLAATDLDPFYGRGGKQDVIIKAELPAKTRVWIPNSKNVVWPRNTFPKQLTAGDGPGIWLELVGCELLGDEKFLDAYLAYRLEERVTKAKSGNKKDK